MDEPLRARRITSWRDLDLLTPERLYRALELLLIRDRERRFDRQYIRGYRRFPETEDDHPWGNGFWGDLLDEAPWE